MYFKIIMTTSVTRPCFSTQYHADLQDQDQDRFFLVSGGQTDLVLRPTVSDHITARSRLVPAVVTLLNYLVILVKSYQRNY